MRQPIMPPEKIIQAVQHMADIEITAEQLDYLRPSGIQIITAIRNDDPEALTAYVTMGVVNKLREAGFDGALTSQQLRDHVGKFGWTLIDDAAAGDANAAAVLKSKLQGTAGGSRLAASVNNGRNGGTAPHQQRQQSHGYDGRSDRSSVPPGHSRSQQNAPPRSQGYGSNQQSRGQGAPQERRHQQSRSESGYNNGSARNSQDERPAGHRGQGEPTRQSNVRSINSAPGPQNDQMDLEERKANQKKVFGGKAGLHLEPDTTRKNVPTIRMEACKAAGSRSQGNLTYNWNDKVTIQLTTYELQVVTALLYGMIPSARFSSHGPKQDKWFSFEHQTGQYAGTIKVAVGEGKGNDKLCIVPITANDIGDVVALFTRECAKQMRLEQPALLNALRPVAKAYTEANNARPQMNRAANG